MFKRIPKYGASEMARQVKALTDIPKTPNLMSRTNMVKGKNQKKRTNFYKLSYDLHIQTTACAHASSCIHKHIHA